MGDIGRERREVELAPLTEPAQDPASVHRPETAPAPVAVPVES